MIIEIKTILSHIIPALPIIGAGVVSEDKNENIVKLSTSSIISRVLELAILGGIFLYVNVQVMHNKMEILNETFENHVEDCKKSRLEYLETRELVNRLIWQHEQEAAQLELRRKLHEPLSN